MLPKFEHVPISELVWMYSVYAIVIIISVISNVRTTRIRKKLEESSIKMLDGVSRDEKLKRIRQQYSLIKYRVIPHELIALTLMTGNLVFLHFAVIVFSGKTFFSYVFGGMSFFVILIPAFRVWFCLKYGIIAKNMTENNIEIPRDSNNVLDFAFTVTVFGPVVLLLNLYRIDVLIALFVGCFVSLIRLNRLITRNLL